MRCCSLFAQVGLFDALGFACVVFSPFLVFSCLVGGSEQLQAYTRCINCLGCVESSLGCLDA